MAHPARSAYARFLVLSARTGADREGQQGVDTTRLGADRWAGRARATDALDERLARLLATIPIDVLRKSRTGGQVLHQGWMAAETLAGSVHEARPVRPTSSRSWR
jgi:hypothetical protein